MKLKLMAAASHHTADFKVLAAEYRFAAEGLESLTPEVKAGFLETAKQLKKEEVAEMTKAIAACKGKTGLEFIVAVLNEAEKSPILKQKAEQITNSIKPKSSKSNTANNKTATSWGDSWAHILMNTSFHKKLQSNDPQDPLHGTGPLTKVVNFIYRQGVKLGMLILTASFIYMFVSYGASEFVKVFFGNKPEILPEIETIGKMLVAGTGSMVLGICVKLFGIIGKLFYPKA